MSEERAKILQMVADGKISAEQASQLLAALGDPPLPPPVLTGGAGGGPGELPAGESEPSPPLPMPHFGSLWLIPMYVGLALFVCGALAVFPLYAASGSWLWLLCGWPVFLIGLLTMVAGWFARTARWIHIRITNVDGSRRSIKLSFPLPLRLTAWTLKVASRFSNKLKETGIDEIIVALNEGLKSDQPLIVDVQDDDDGERVQVYIG
jgi:hypothetical protein